MHISFSGEFRGSRGIPRRLKLQGYFRQNDTMDFCILYYAGYPQKGIPGKSSSGIGVFLSTL
jgi:hypothetical protein